MKKVFTLAGLLLACIVVFAQEPGKQMYLWPNGAPGFENLKDQPEEAKDWWVKNVHNPSITVYYPPKDKANGTAVLICPGGGHRTLVYNGEGKEAADFLNSLGITAFVLKYRLAREENSPYTVGKEAKEDAYRALRTVRSRAKEFGVNPERIGIMGFSAGGEVVSWVAYGDGKGDSSAKDPIDKVNGKPDFQMLVYPGPLGIPATVPADAPPVFMVVATNDDCCSEPVMSLLLKYRQAKRPVEAHVYAKGAHAFNMGYRSEFISLRGWPQRMADWLMDMGYLTGK
ncbi:alpha/beta hydrolase [uncultured Imperialibacter sp.]|uniref:alpha/beta hydrolase n=1 Tax=uncultured Imperialibacter sp. TaxID=1672639 RepID=UPI0030D87CD1|tara:strand:- start:31129 stop:31983 length:855 start_codon:yes stop_codon:yes gene_type:complete